jgi:N-acetylmuramoyl-L-alanine amidase
MRPPAALFARVLTSATGVALTAALLAPVTGAAAAPTAPAPYVIAVDPGHGGAPDDNHPDQLYDPGATDNGLLEKDLTLDVAKRLRGLLEAKGVRVVMTRDHDVYTELSARLDTATRAQARLFVSIHFNHFPDPAVAGSLVMYPNDQSAAFAQQMSDTLRRELAAVGIAGNGILANPGLWVHATVPTVTVEGAYLSSPADAAQVKQPAVLDRMAHAISTGIVMQAPEIKQIQAQTAAYRAAQARTVARPKAAASVPVVQLGATALVVVLVVLGRRPLIGIAAMAANAGAGLLSASAGSGRRRRRRRGRARLQLPARDLPTLSIPRPVPRR